MLSTYQEAALLVITIATSNTSSDSSNDDNQCKMAPVTYKQAVYCCALPLLITEKKVTVRIASNSDGFGEIV